MTTISLLELARLLEDAGATESASECHGALCGALCVHETYTARHWLRDVLLDEVVIDDADGFTGVIDATLATLRAGDMRFTPLLPDDDVALSLRAAALGEWCEGFLYGLGTGGLDARVRLPADVAEILEDFAEISRAGADEGESAEDDEVAYAELVEFVRVGAQLVHDEFAGLRRNERGS
jgi:uncharacterized protein